MTIKIKFSCFCNIFSKPRLLLRLIDTNRFFGLFFFCKRILRGEILVLFFVHRTYKMIHVQFTVRSGSIRTICFEEDRLKRFVANRWWTQTFGLTFGPRDPRGNTEKLLRVSPDNERRQYNFKIILMRLTIKGENIDSR